MKKTLVKPIEPDFLSTTEAANLLCISPQALRDRTDKNQIDVYFDENSTHRKYDEYDVLTMLRKEQGHTSMYLIQSFLQMNGAKEFHVDPHTVMHIPEINKFVKYNNGLDRVNKQLLADGHSAAEFDQESIELFDNETGVEIQIALIALAFTEADCEDILAAELKKSKEWLLNNTIPVTGVCSWTDLTGKPYRK